MSAEASSDETEPEWRDILCLGNSSRRVGLWFSSMIKRVCLPKIAKNLFKAKPSLAYAIKTINDHDWNMLTPSLAGDSEKAAHVPKSIQYKNWADKSPGGKCGKDSSPNVDS